MLSTYGTVIDPTLGPASAAIVRAASDLPSEQTRLVKVRALESFQSVCVPVSSIDAFVRRLVSDETVTQIQVADAIVFSAPLAA